MPLATRTFAMADQLAFAGVSLDVNPMHVDALAARRTLFGRPVVHGVHLVLWALDSWFTQHPGRPTRLAVNFSKPCFVDEPVEIEVARHEAGRARLRVSSGGLMLTDVRVELGGEPIRPTDRRPASDAVSTPCELSLEQLAGLSGEVSIPPESPATGAMFPRLCHAVGEVTVAELMALSRLVGMESPGLHSLFAGFEVDLRPGGASERLRWSVTSTDERFAMVTMAVEGGVLQGVVRAFVRPRPSQQATAAEMAGVVRPGEFAPSTALVVGGSRGLGELAAKAIAAGGGSVLLTYQHGAEDAAAVVSQIRAAGGRASALHLDVADPRPAFDDLRTRGEAPSHLFYFASPRIFARRNGLFDADLFQTFCDAYITGFTRLLEGCRALGSPTLTVFYPSTVAIDEMMPELREYCAAKIAGEHAIEVLEASEPWLTILVQRLPRLPTDQTATMSHVEEADPVSTIVGAVRATFRAGTLAHREAD